MNLQETIRRVLREEDYSPAGKEIKPNSIIVHKSNPMFRDKIMEDGLKVRTGECYKTYVGYGVKCKPAIFATNTTNKRAWFDSTYDDDIWFIDTRMIPDVKWYKDRHFESIKKHIVTFQDIPKEAITLKYEGTGSGDVKTWSKDSPNLYESIRRILREEKLYATPQQLVKNLPDELKKLLFKQWGAKQNPEWHPEGNTLKHILVVLKRAYHHYPDDPNMVMAALFHDLGKMDTYSINPKTNQPTAYGHEDKSTDYVEQFRNWIDSFDGTDVDEIKYLVKNHMKVKPRTWDQMKDKKKEPIKSHPAFDKLMGFTDKLDGGGVDLKESIRRTLREELSGADKMKKQIHKMGLYQFMKLSGLSWADIVSILGVDFLSYKMMADFIPNALNYSVGGFDLTEIDEDPIPYSSNEYEERQINYLGVNRAIVDVWGGNNFEKNLGEFGVHYYNLPDDILEQVFDIVMTVYEENKNRF